MKRKIKKITGLRKVARAHAVFFLISFGLYVALTAILTPSFMLSDMRNKSKALADDTITLVAKVLAPPVEPIISGEATCVSDSPRVTLDWPDDENSETFDIDRNGSTLITGLTDSNYEDTALPVDRSYNTYVVTAHGPMGPGVAASTPLSITNPEECTVPFSPTQKITTFEENLIETYEDTPQITSQKPSFSGKTNIPFATIFITLHSGPTITATIYANENGYWSWVCPETLDLGTHTLIALAVDPNDPTVTSSDTFSFEIAEEASDQESTNDHKKKATKKTTRIQSPTSAPLIVATAPFAISVSVKNPDHIVYAGNNLSIHTDFTKKSSSLEDRDYEIFYTVVDSDGNTLSEISEKINPTQIDSLEKNIPIAILAKAGKYKVIVKTYNGRDLIEGEDFFQVKEFPIVSVGSTSISLTQIMQGLGWISLFFLLLFLVLLGIEWRQSEYALVQITENYLRRHGFMTKRKGVSR